MNKFSLSLKQSIDYGNETVSIAAYDAEQEIYRWYMDTRDEMIKDALIKLGWTPPPKP